MNIPVFGELTGAWVDGEKARNRFVRREPDGGTVYRVQPIASRAQPSQVTLRISHAPGRYSGAAIYRPIDCDCAAGKARLGEWSEIGLSSYSGGMWYRKDVILSKEHLGGKLWLDLGGVSATAEVRINGKRADVLVAPPWRVDITPFVRTGNNRVEILVANTLANHYSIGIPSLYVFPGQTTSGLLGPVRIEIWPEVVLRSQ